MTDSWKTRGWPITGYMLLGLRVCGNVVSTLWKHLMETGAVIHGPGQGRKKGCGLVYLPLQTKYIPKDLVSLFSSVPHKGDTKCCREAPEL
ncbi:hypothetical protein TNCV_3148541 [Trichonephila clavipes]|nr:hypothetical protein TNCV_3148541 [Trichonephila clavipes]